MIRYVKQIREDENTRKRSKGFVWDGVWWFMFLMLGWWMRGFVNDFYGTNLSFSEVLVRVIGESGGFKALVLFLVSVVGSATGVLIKLRKVFQKRDGEE